MKTMDVKRCDVCKRVVEIKEIRYNLTDHHVLMSERYADICSTACMVTVAAMKHSADEKRNRDYARWAAANGKAPEEAK